MGHIEERHLARHFHWNMFSIACIVNDVNPKVWNVGPVMGFIIAAVDDVLLRNVQENVLQVLQMLDFFRSFKSNFDRSLLHWLCPLEGKYGL